MRLLWKTAGNGSVKLDNKPRFTAKMQLTDEMITEIGMPIMVTGLMLYMAFIIYNLGKKSEAGKFGMFVLFLGLAVGMLGFVMKYVIKFFLGDALE